MRVDLIGNTSLQPFREMAEDLSGRDITFVVEPNGRIIRFLRIEEQELIALMDCEHEILQTQAAKICQEEIRAQQKRAGGSADSREK